jgi:hypothetical protein
MQHRSPLWPFVAVGVVILSCAVWANAAYWVDPDGGFELFPPFDATRNRVHNHHLGAEYNSIAEALWAGRGFADPFRDETGPTAWMPPVFPFLQLALIRLTGNDLVAMKYALVGCQVLAYLATAWLVLAAVARAYRPSRRWLAAGVLVVLFASEFYHAFQVTHDPWLMMLGLDVLLVGHIALGADPDRSRAAAWGAVGGLAALCGPVLGVVWAGLTWLRWPVRRRWAEWLVAGCVAVAVLTPWVVRNYRTFGKVIPVKSNLFYELYQAQCASRDGLVGNGPGRGFQSHPWRPGPERDRYHALGEQAFLKEKQETFLRAVRADPGEFAVRVWNRFAAATVAHVPGDFMEEELPPSVWTTFPHAVHPLPFLAAVVLVVSPRRLHRYERAALVAYAAWLLPYVVVSYYGRYGFPLLGVKAFLCVAALDRCWGLAAWFRAPPGRSRPAASPTPPPEGRPLSNQRRHS